MILANDQYYLQKAYHVSKPTNPFAFRKCNTEGPPTLTGKKNVIVLYVGICFSHFLCIRGVEWTAFHTSFYRALENDWHVPWPRPNQATPKAPLQHTFKTELSDFICCCLKNLLWAWSQILSRHSLFIALTLCQDSSTSKLNIGPYMHILLQHLKHKRRRSFLLAFSESCMNCDAFITSPSKATNHWNGSIPCCVVRNPSFSLIQVT